MANDKESTRVTDGGDVVVSPPSAKRTIESRPTDKTITLYANNTLVEASNWDIKIKLGLIQSVTAELLTVEDVAHVYMSHEHARAFMNALAKTMTQVDKLITKQPTDTHAAPTP
jgi:hypothetical protein